MSFITKHHQEGYALTYRNSTKFTTHCVFTTDYTPNQLTTQVIAFTPINRAQSSRCLFPSYSLHSDRNDYKHEVLFSWSHSFIFSLKLRVDLSVGVSTEDTTRVFLRFARMFLYSFAGFLCIRSGSPIVLENSVPSGRIELLCPNHHTHILILLCTNISSIMISSHPTKFTPNPLCHLPIFLSQRKNSEELILFF